MKVGEIVDTKTIKHSKKLIIPILFILLTVISIFIIKLRYEFSEIEGKFQGEINTQICTSIFTKEIEGYYQMSNHYNTIISAFPTITSDYRRKYYKSFTSYYLANAHNKSVFAVLVDFKEKDNNSENNQTALNMESFRLLMYRDKAQARHLFFSQFEKDNRDILEKRKIDTLYPQLLNPELLKYYLGDNKDDSNIENSYNVLPLVAPILDSNDIMIGRTELHINVDSFQTRIKNKISHLGFDFVGLIHSNIFLYHPDSKMIGKTLLDDNYMEAETDKNITLTYDVNFDGTDSSGKHVYCYLMQVNIKLAGEPLFVFVTLPYDSFYEQMNEYIIKVIAITLLLFLLICLVVHFVVNNTNKNFTNSEIIEKEDIPELQERDNFSE